MECKAATQAVGGNKMKGNLIEETIKKIVYDGEYYAVVVSPSYLLKMSKMLSKKGITATNSAIANEAQKRMRKLANTVITADEWGKDFSTIYNKIVDDVNNYKPIVEE